MSGTSKFYKQKKQVSYDNGATWQDVVPAQYQKGNLYELNSPDCGYEQLERWVNSGTTCSGASGYDKYYIQVKQTSTDGGITWATTSDTRLGTLIEANSYDCGYVSTAKFKATYSNSRTYSAECDSNTTLTTATTKPSGYDYSTMTSAEIGNCVTTIGNFAFYNCYSLRNLVIPDSVTSIGYASIYHCSSLTSITIPDSVTFIGDWAFGWSTGLISISIGSGVTGFGGSYTFCECRSLTGITVDSNNNYFSSQNGVLFDKTKQTLICYPYNKQNTYYIIPNSVSGISDCTFYGNRSLTSCTIGNNVTSIGDKAFFNCTFLKNISIGSGVTSIGDEVFIGCGVTGITVDSNNNYYSSENGVLFDKSKQTLICYPSKKQGTYYDISNTVTSIGNNAFENCGSLTSVTIPNSVTEICNDAFSSCYSLSSIDIPSGVTSIGWNVFSSCSSLSSVTIGSGITSIGGQAFWYCSSLTSVTCLATTPPTLEENPLTHSGPFDNTNNCPIYVPANSVTAYKSASGWSDYSSRIQAIP